MAREASSDDLFTLVTTYLGGLQPGVRVPSARELAAHFGVGRMRMHLVMKQLIGAGLVRKEGYRLTRAKAEVPTAERITLFTSEPDHVAPAVATARAFGVDLKVVCQSEPSSLRRELLQLKPGSTGGILSWYHRGLDILSELDRQRVPVVACGHAWIGHSFVTGEASWLFEVAIGHLVKLGHREIALWRWNAENLPRFQLSDLDREFLRACERAGLEASPSRVKPMVTKRDLSRAWATFLREQPRPTALVCMELQMVQAILDLAHRNKVAVPEDLSILSLREKPEAARFEPPVTTVDTNDAMVTQIGMNLLLQKMRRMSLRPFHQGVRCDPTLTLRQSTEVVSLPSSVVPSRAADSGEWWSKWSNDREARLAQAAEVNAQGFPDVDGPSCRSVDLGRYVNRSFGPRSAWFGDQPLRHFAQGDHVIHGIPFAVARGANPRLAAVMLRSSKAKATGGVPLPVEVTIPLSGRARSLFFLHAAAWTVVHEPIALYEISWKGGRRESLPVLPYSSGSSDAFPEKARREAAIVQDWHPSFPRFQNDRVRPWLVLGNGDPLIYERTLYVFRWLNPHPEWPLESFSMQALAPQTRASVALLGLTVEAI